ncbi:MAG: glycosyltransferase family 4 protein [Methanosarcinaceae archaeon]|nr:glycosyltransferase family 4 protein [Methanosarcinaceae archaeon]
MNPLLLSKSDNNGGASKAAYRLHQALQKTGLSSRMLVQQKRSNDDTVIGSESNLKRRLARYIADINKLPLRFYPNRRHTIFSPQWFPDIIAGKVMTLNPDIVQLHWICKGYMRIETLGKLKMPIVWTFHDMWALTGGCHYSGGCERYALSCGRCPQLKSKKEADLSQWVWRRKSRSWKNLDLTIVAPSNWMAQCARASSLFKNLRIEVIPNCIDTKVYRPINRDHARHELGLPQGKKVILFGAPDPGRTPRKGFDLLLKALKETDKSDMLHNAELVVFGDFPTAMRPELGLKIHFLGRISEDVMLAQVYSAADVFVLPSREDNLPNTVLESMACGTPCVGFRIGGVPDLIDHEQNGYLAPPFDTDDLAHGIARLLSDNDLNKRMSQNARQKVETKFTPNKVAQQYIKLYTDILSA